MKREIKFRAWVGGDKSCGGRMLSWDELLDPKYISGKTGLELREFFNLIYPTNPPRHCYNIMQYTGLKDKNGKEIYEGDIVKWNVAIAEVVFDRGQFCYRSPNSKKAIRNVGIGAWGYTTIIGNIYENPELLSNKTE